MQSFGPSEGVLMFFQLSFFISITVNIHAHCNKLNIPVSENHSYSNSHNYSNTQFIYSIKIRNVFFFQIENRNHFLKI